MAIWVDNIAIWDCNYNISKNGIMSLLAWFSVSPTLYCTVYNIILYIWGALTWLDIVTVMDSVQMSINRLSTVKHAACTAAQHGTVHTVERACVAFRRKWQIPARHSTTQQHVKWAKPEQNCSIFHLLLYSLLWSPWFPCDTYKCLRNCAWILFSEALASFSCLIINVTRLGFLSHALFLLSPVLSQVLM